ncbi:unnamed protein product [Heterobilharzia americana]|nr:unnamed protein product [Heterobilharzia americana]
MLNIPCIQVDAFYSHIIFSLDFKLYKSITNTYSELPYQDNYTFLTHPLDIEHESIQQSETGFTSTSTSNPSNVHHMNATSNDNCSID